jgi:lipid A 3-O-deacylase
MIRKTAVLAALLLVSISNAHALDSASFEFGVGNEGTDLWRAGVQRKWQRRWFAERSWTLGAYWDLQVGRWTGRVRAGQSEREQNIWDISLTPVFRLERAQRTGIAPYVEGAIGFHALSDLRINQRRLFSTHFQYGDHLGAGLRFGPEYRYDASLRVQHLSNGGLARPNPGINFLQLRLAYHF